MLRRHCMSIVALWIGLVAAWPQPARAQVAVSNLRVGTDPAVSTARSTVPIGTRTLYAAYDFSQADGNRVALDVTAYGGVVVFSASERLRANGTRTVAIDGTSVLGRLTAELVATAQAARGSARDAAAREFGTEEYLGAVQAAVIRLGHVRTVLAAVRTPFLRPADLDTLADLETQVNDLAERARRAASDEQRRLLAGRMDAPLEEAVAVAVRLSSSASEARGVGLPVSGQAWQYVVLLSVDGSPADSVEFMVDGSSLWLPTTSRHAPVIR